MSTTTILMLCAALLGVIGREAISIIPAIKDDDTSPSRFSFAYYFSRPKNQVLLVLNLCGSGILFLARHEVAEIAGAIPLLSDYLDGGTPMLLSGAIGFGGASAMRWLSRIMSKAEKDQ
jgi:hypothetical protein